MARSDPQFNLRIPQELKEQIEKSAKDDGRSINAQAVHLLQVGLDHNQTPIKNSKQYMFAEWNYLDYDDNRLVHNEKARMACSAYLTQFFNDFPEHTLVKFEFISDKDPKGREIIRGIRIWYTY